MSPRARRGPSIGGSLPYGVSGEKEQADAYFSDLLSYRYDTSAMWRESIYRCHR